MSYVRSLTDLLREKNIGLYNRLAEIEKIARDILQYTQAKFPYYTPHGFKHSENVLENLNWLLPEDVKAELNPHELFFLIVAAWMHDWGLVGEPGENSEEIRENHHVRTEEKFEKHFSLIHVHLNEARIIGRICRGHRKENLYDGSFEDIPFEAGILIHRQFLTAALRMADEVDITASRVPEIIYYELNPTEKSEEEFKKQMNVIGIAYPSEKERYKLTLSAVAWDPLGLEAINKLGHKIQCELNQIKTILASGVNHKGMNLGYVEVKPDTRGFMKDPIEFEIDKQKVLDLLIGRSLYPRKDAAIRELVQNSIDACRLRKTEMGDYDAEIVITQDENNISVEDNGIGMDFTTAKKYLSRVGSSYYSSEDFRKTLSGKEGFDPISRWGLGFLSCFLISSKVTIETKKAEAKACRFIITNVDRGWRYEAGSREKSGTTVTLALNNEGKLIDAFKVLEFYVKQSSIPIFEQNNSSKNRFVPKWNIKKELEERLKNPEFKQLLKYSGKPSIAYEYSFENEEFDV
jgi:molecular chaperone HtpG